MVVAVVMGGGGLDKAIVQPPSRVSASVQHCVNPRVMRGLIAQAIKMNIITNLASVTPDQNTDSSTHTQARAHTHAYTNGGCLEVMLK